MLTRYGGEDTVLTTLTQLYQAAIDADNWHHREFHLFFVDVFTLDKPLA